MENNMIEEIRDINEVLFEETHDPKFTLTYSTDAFSESISMNIIGGEINGSIDIWNSENEERDWIEAKNDYECFGSFLKRETSNYLDNVRELNNILIKHF